MTSPSPEHPSSHQPTSTDERQEARRTLQHRLADNAPPSAIDDRTTQFAIDVARALADAKCTDIIALDVRGLSDIADAIVIATGTSDRQMRSAMDDVREVALRTGLPEFRIGDDAASGWLVGDFLQAIVHVFEPNTRAHYDLEMLWGDAPKVRWQRPNDPR